jgi:hypothetical protein
MDEWMETHRGLHIVVVEITLPEYSNPYGLDGIDFGKNMRRIWARYADIMRAACIWKDVGA